LELHQDYSLTKRECVALLHYDWVMVLDTVLVVVFCELQFGNGNRHEKSIQPRTDKQPVIQRVISLNSVLYILLMCFLSPGWHDFPYCIYMYVLTWLQVFLQLH